MSGSPITGSRYRELWRGCTWNLEKIGRVGYRVVHSVQDAMREDEEGYQIAS